MSAAVTELLFPDRISWEDASSFLDALENFSDSSTVFRP